MTFLDETDQDTNISGGSIFDHFTFCDIRDSNDCILKTDGIFNTCQAVTVQSGNLESKSRINICIPKRLGCDTHLHCNTIGNPHKGGSLRAECITGLCQYQTFVTFN